MIRMRLSNLIKFLTIYCKKITKDYAVKSPEPKINEQANEATYIQKMHVMRKEILMIQIEWVGQKLEFTLIIVKDFCVHESKQIARESDLN